MRFQRLDLNLLVALDALLSERSVSLAADRLCLSQSATSSTLGRLRDYFKDELLVLKGRQMILTPRAEKLIEPVRAVLEQIRTTIAVEPDFEPASCDRQVRIMASDYMTEVLVSKGLAHFHEVAPNMRFEIMGMASNPIEALERGFVDLLMTLDFAISPDHPSEVLFTDDYVVVGSEDNPAMQDEITQERYFELGHVTARFGKSRVPAFDEWFTRRQKRQRRIEVIAPSFLSMPSFLVDTTRIATLHRKLALKLARRHPLIVRETPFEFPQLREMVQWSIINSSDVALRWVVGEFQAVARKLDLDVKNGENELSSPNLDVLFAADHARS